MAYAAVVGAMHVLERSTNGAATAMALCVFALSACSLAVLAPQSFTLGEALLCVQSSALLAMTVFLNVSCPPTETSAAAVGPTSFSADARAENTVTVTLLAGGLCLVQVWLPLCKRMCSARASTTSAVVGDAALDRTHSPGAEGARIYTDTGTQEAVPVMEVGKMAATAQDAGQGVLAMNVLLLAGVAVVLGPIISVALGMLSPVWLWHYVVASRRHLYCAAYALVGVHAGASVCTVLLACIFRNHVYYAALLSHTSCAPRSPVSQFRLCHVMQGDSRVLDSWSDWRRVWYWCRKQCYPA